MANVALFFYGARVAVLWSSFSTSLKSILTIDYVVAFNEVLFWLWVKQNVNKYDVGSQKGSWGTCFIVNCSFFAGTNSFWKAENTRKMGGRTSILKQ